MRLFSRTTTDLSQLRKQAARSRQFNQARATFEQADVATWITLDEMQLLYGIGAYYKSVSRLVEIGTYEGGSASFFASGLRERGTGKLACVDPFLGAPPWLGVVPRQRTLEKFNAAMKLQDLEKWVERWVGDSASVSAVWPAEKVDVVHIDGDHSFEGALSDLECWGPKVRQDGLILFDDANDALLTELLDLIDALKQFESIHFVGQVEGIAVFRRTSGDPLGLYEELRALKDRRGVYRAWDMQMLHELPLPANYVKPENTSNDALSVLYQLAFMAPCGPGPYGLSSRALEEYKTTLTAVSKDKRDGECVDMSEERGGFRAIVCDIEEARTFAPRLQACGVLFACNLDHSEDLDFRKRMLEAGLVGCGYNKRTHWGFWKPHQITVSTLLERLVHTYHGRDPTRS